jgi:hypothetical protein
VPWMRRKSRIWPTLWDEAANKTLGSKMEEDGVDQLLSRSCQMMEVGAKGKRRRAVNAVPEEAIRVATRMIP